MENGEQRYPNREQLEAGMELANAIGPGRATRFRQMLNMTDDLDTAVNAGVKLAYELESVKELLKIEAEANNKANDELTEARDLVRRMAAWMDKKAEIIEDYDQYRDVNAMINEADAMTKGEP